MNRKAQLSGPELDQWETAQATRRRNSQGVFHSALALLGD